MGSFDWKAYLDLGVQLMGHTQTHENFLQNLDAVHYFELQLRKNLSAERQGVVKELVPIHLRGDSDVVLSVKKQLSDKEFSQCPMVFVPGQWLKDLSPHGPWFCQTCDHFGRYQEGVDENSPESGSRALEYESGRRILA